MGARTLVPLDGLLTKLRLMLSTSSSLGSGSSSASSFASSFTFDKSDLPSTRTISDLTADEKAELTVFGCSVEDLCLDFTSPDGHELISGGSDITVTLSNLEQYVKAMTQYYLGPAAYKVRRMILSGFANIARP